jgi:membrane-associated phospholipid phosphatase
MSGSVLALLCAAPRSGAQAAAPADSVHRADSSAATRAHQPWVTPRDGALFAAAVVATTIAAPLDHTISNEFEEPHWRDDRAVLRAASDAAFFGGDGPFLLSGALLVAGSGNATLRRFAIHDMEAIALATAITGVVKGIAGRALPGVPTRHAFELGRGFHDANGPFVSFPSGHTAAAFALAATIAGEVERADSSRRRMIDLLAFGGAATVGVARVVQHVHWTSDLPLAAVIGTWSGRTVQRHAGDGGKIGAILRGLTIAPAVRGQVRLGWIARFGGSPNAR